MTHRLCVSTIITRPDSTLLLVHKPRERDAWQVAQGGIEEGETPEQAASRELEEETGIIVDPALFERCEQTYQYDFPEDFIKAENPRSAGQHLTFVKAKVPQDTEVIVDNRELDGFEWVRVEEIGEYLEREEYMKVVVEAVD